MIATAFLVLLAACGPASPTPTVAPVVEETTEVPTTPAPVKIPGQVAGRLLFIRGGNLWLWQGGQATRLTDACGCKQPRWSPTGDALLYIKMGDSYGDLIWADGAGQNARPLTANRAVNLQPETKEYIANSFLLSGLSWARTANNTDRIVYSSDRGGSGLNLFVTNGLSSKPVAIAGTKDLGGGVEGAALSPDGNTVAFVHDLTDEKTGRRATQVFLLDLATGKYRVLTSEANGAYDPAWSPDGQWLTYAARQATGKETNLWLIRPDGTGRQRLTEGGKDRGVAWSPDGDQLAFVRQLDNGFALYFADISVVNGVPTTGKPIRVGDFSDVEPSSGVSWAR
jgi:TolB protein